MRRAFALAFAFASSCLALASPAFASPEDLFGYGARTSAMGATGAAHAAGAETAFHNPALASTTKRTVLSLGYGGAVFGLDAHGSDGTGGRVSTPAAKGIYAGLAVPIPFGGQLRDRVGLALAFYTPSDALVRARVLYPETPQFPLLGARAETLTVRAGIGAEIGWGLRVGVGASALADLVGVVTTGADAAGNVSTRVDQQLVATYAPTVGVTWELPLSNLRFGATFRGTLDARFDVLVDATKLSSIPIPQFDIAGTAQYDPAELAVELARIEPLGAATLGAGGDAIRTSSVLAVQVVYKRWRDFSGFREPTVVCSEGGPGACGLAPPPIAWRDTLAVRLGAEEGFELASGVVLHARGGGFVETSPLPADLPGSDAFDVATKNTVHVPTLYFDATRVVITSGAGLSLANKPLPIDLDLFLQYHLLLSRTLTSAVAGTDLSQVEVSGHAKVFGLIGSVRL
jgi:long-chain fatty acid transport protein